MNELSFTGTFDGSTYRTNPSDITGIGARIVCGPSFYTISKTVGPGTNNTAEWSALIALLEFANELKIKNLYVYGDSKLVINQVNGKWKVKDSRMVAFKQRAKELELSFDSVTYGWIPREHNKEADYLSKACLPNHSSQ